MLTEKDLKELIKQGKIKTNDFDFEEEQQDDIQKQKLELEKQKIELQKQKLELEKTKLKKEQAPNTTNKIKKSGILYSLLMIFGSLAYVIVYFMFIRH